MWTIEGKYYKNNEIIGKHLKSGCYRALFDSVSSEYNSSTIEEKLEALDNILKEVEPRIFLLAYIAHYTENGRKEIADELPHTLLKLLGHSVSK